MDRHRFLRRFYPDQWVASAYCIDYQQWYEKGYRAIAFDIDNTLVPHGAPADGRAVQLFRQLHTIGFRTCLISNNKKSRVAPFAEEVHSDYLCMANKPSVRGYRKACERISVPTDRTLFVGDQLFTDVWGAKRAGLYTILVRPINPKEEIQIVLKRRLEKPVLRAYAADCHLQEPPEATYASETKCEK
ncbi:MAG: YqeG family HAD IIIA-type phosphatase [Bilifractor sp.]